MTVPPDPVLPEVVAAVAVLVVLEPEEAEFVPPEPVLPEVVAAVTALVVLEPAEAELVPPEPVLPEVVAAVAALVVLEPVEAGSVEAEPVEAAAVEAAAVEAAAVEDELVEDAPVEDVPPVVDSVELLPPAPLEYCCGSDSGLPQAAPRKRGSVIAARLIARFDLTKVVLMSLSLRYPCATCGRLRTAEFRPS